MNAKIYILVFWILQVNLVQAQIDWQVGDRFNFKVSKGEWYYDDGTPEYNKKLAYESSIQVLDSSSSGYKVMYSTYIYGWGNFDQRLKYINEFSPDFGKIHIRYKIDKKGRIRKILNMDEIYNRHNYYIKKIIREFYAKDSKLISEMNNLRALFATEDFVRHKAYEELNVFHLLLSRGKLTNKTISRKIAAYNYSYFTKNDISDFLPQDEYISFGQHETIAYLEKLEEDGPTHKVSYIYKPKEKLYLIYQDTDFIRLTRYFKGRMDKSKRAEFFELKRVD